MKAQILKYLASLGWDIALNIIRALSGVITPFVSDKLSVIIKTYITRLDKLVCEKIKDIK